MERSGRLENECQPPITVTVFYNGECHLAMLHADRPHPPVSYHLDKARLLDLHQSFIELDAQRQSETQLMARASRDDRLLEEIGAETFGLLFPESIRSFLSRAAPTALYLQLDESLIHLPWECAFNGKRFLSTTFDIARQTFTSGAEAEYLPRKTLSGTLGILLLVGDGTDPELAVQVAALEARTRGNGSFNLKVRSSREYSVTQLEEAARECSVVHYLGSLDGFGFDLPSTGWSIGGRILKPVDLASGCRYSKLFVSEVCAPGSGIEIEASETEKFVRACCPGQVSHIVHFSRVTHACRIAFASNLYAGLAQGNTIGVALTRARANLHDRYGAGWSGYHFYGEPTQKLVSTIGESLVPANTPAKTEADVHDFSEYRQLTVMFCDLVGSTPMSQRLDAEDWQTILKLYQDECASIVNRHGGQVHEYKGDGLVVYFGFPTAYEDSALRAVRAGIEICRSVNDMFFGVVDLLSHARIAKIQLRIAVHTGPVIIGEMGGRLTATGLTLAYTERLQHAAPPNSVVISKDTRQLVVDRFEFEHLGERQLKGISTPCDVYRVIREAERRPQIAAFSTRSLTRFVGRAVEISILEEEWQAVVEHRRRVVLVSGDAGIGKSRLVREFVTSLCEQQVTTFECRCSPYHQNTALYPLIHGLENILHFDRSLSHEEKLALIEGAVPPQMSAATVVPVVASLLSIKYSPKYLKLRGSPDKQKQFTHQVLMRWAEFESECKPICVVVEDVHWIDPSSLEILQRLIENTSDRPIFLVLTYRTEGSHSWTCPFESRPISLGRLEKDSVKSMISSIPGGAELPARVADDLIERTDGVPLFVEESTTMAAESCSATYSKSNHQVFSIPTTVQDLLTARLDSLGPAKEIAQVGATIGREFSFEVLRLASSIEESELMALLERIVDSGLVRVDASDKPMQFSFKHALVRDAAYKSLLRKKRRSLHGRIARVLEQGVETASNTEPEILAYHFTEARIIDRAIGCWMVAGRHAKRRSAYAEAINHYRQSLNLLAELTSENPPEQKKIELQIQIGLANCYTVTKGYSADEVCSTYGRAEKLASELGASHQLMQARIGLESFHFMRANFAQAYELAQLCLTSMSEGLSLLSVVNAETESRQAQQVMALSRAHWALGNILFHEGKFDRAMPQMEQCILLCDRISPRPRGMLQDPEVMCRVYQAWYAWEAGYPDQALQKVNTAVDLARELGHPFTIGVALAFCGCIHFFRREYEMVIAKADESIELCEEPGFRIWLAWAKVLRGRAMAESKEFGETGVAEINAGIRLWDDSQAIVTRPFILALLGEAHQLNGRSAEGLELLTKADKGVRQFGDRYYEAEIKRLLGKLMLCSSSTSGQSNQQMAEKWLLEAVNIAKSRKLRSSELRATTDLAVVHFAQGMKFKAVTELQAIVSWFSEGFETGDFVAARELLERMRDEHQPLAISDYFTTEKTG